MNQHIACGQTVYVRVFTFRQRKMGCLLRRRSRGKAPADHRVGESQVSIHCVDRLRRRSNGLVVEPASPFPRVAQTHQGLRVARSTDDGRPQQSLKIQREVRPTPGHRCPRPFPQLPSAVPAPEQLAGKFDDLVHRRIAGEQRHPFRVGQPGNPAVWPGRFQTCHRRQRVDDVAERTRLEDEQRTRGRSLRTTICQWRDGPRAVWVVRRRGSFSARCGCRTPAAAVR